MLQPDEKQCIIQIITGKQLLIWKNAENIFKLRKTARTVLLQTASTSTEKMQLFCNTHIYTVCHDIIISFHQPAQGDRRMIFTQKLILNNQT